MRKQFQLSEEDEQCLAALGLEWEALIDGNAKWLIVHSYLIPEGYSHQRADAALRIPPSYPDDQIDMVYFFPGARSDKRKGYPPTHTALLRREAISAMVTAQNAAKSVASGA
jgi:hypothetical protein